MERKIQAPEACPVCGELLKFHTPATKEVFEEWEYSCGCIIHREKAHELRAYNKCGQATLDAVSRLNAAHKRSA